MRDLKIYKTASELDREITKSNIIKGVLIGTTILLALIWLIFLVFGVIPFGYGLEGGLDVKPIQGDYHFINGKYYLTGTKDINPLYLLNGDNPLPLLFLFFAPIGYLTTLFLVSTRFGILTPNKVRTINRKALSLGYLKQSNFDYIVEEMNINIGVKERDENVK